MDTCIDKETEEIIAEILEYCNEEVQPSKKDRGNNYMCHSLASYIITLWFTEIASY